MKPGRLASSDPAEGGCYNNYRSCVFDIALANPEDPNETDEGKILEEARELQFK